MKFLKYIAIAAFTLVFWQVQAQQEVHFSQYYYNTQLINPAYAGYRETMDFTLVHRSQWVGFKGAPHSTVLSVNTPINLIPNMSVGASLVNDIIGPTHEMSVSADFAYKVRLSNRAYLSYGLKASLGLYQVKLAELGVVDQGDQLYANNSRGNLRPNVGAGVYYYKKKYYLGLSIPHFLKTNLTNKTIDGYDLFQGTSDPTAYLSGGFLHRVNRDLKLLPSMTIKAQANTPLSAGIYFSAIFMDQIKAGIFYHYKEVGGGLIQWQMNQQWRLGYSFDLPINTLITTSFGSHELLVNYQMKYKRRRIVYPRYF